MQTPRQSITNFLSGESTKSLKSCCKDGGPVTLKSSFSANQVTSEDTVVVNYSVDCSGATKGGIDHVKVELSRTIQLRTKRGYLKVINLPVQVVKLDGYQAGE